MSKKQKRVLIITAVTLLVALAIVATVLIVVKYNEKKNALLEGYVTLEQLKKSVIPEKTYDNLDLSHAVLNMPQFDDIYDIKWQKNLTHDKEQYMESCTKMSQDILSMMEQHGVDRSDIIAVDYHLNESPDLTPLYDDMGFAVINYFNRNENDSLISGVVDCDDSGSIMASFDNPPEDAPYEVIRKTIRLDLGEQPDDKMYRTMDGEMSVKQAVELAQKYADKYSEYVGGEAVPAYVYVKQFAQENQPPTDETVDNKNPYCFTVVFNKVYEGVPFFSNGFQQHMTEDDEGEYIFRQPQMVITIAEKDCYNTFESLNGYPVLEAVKHEENKYISLQTACDKISELFAPRSEHVIDEISFNYALEYKFGDEDGSIHQAMPCWCFSVYDSDPSVSMIEDTIYVDAVTGDVYFKTEESAGYFKSEETDEYIK